MNFSYKLELILELFDIAQSKNALKGVTRKKGKNHTIYSFKDFNIEGTPSYHVSINKYNSYNEHQKKLLTRFLNISIPGILTDGVYDIELTVTMSDEYNQRQWDETGMVTHYPYGATGYGNQNLVYGKMIACINDYFTRYGIPAILRISPAEEAMILVYDKFIKILGKSRGINYIPIFEDHYALDKIIEATNIDDMSWYYSDYLDKENKRRENDIKNIRASKNTERALKLFRNKLKANHSG